MWILTLWMVASWLGWEVRNVESAASSRSPPSPGTPRVRPRVRPLWVDPLVEVPGGTGLWDRGWEVAGGWDSTGTSSPSESTWNSPCCLVSDCVPRRPLGTWTHMDIIKYIGICKLKAETLHMQLEMVKKIMYKVLSGCKIKV